MNKRRECYKKVKLCLSKKVVFLKKKNKEALFYDKAHSPRLYVKKSYGVSYEDYGEESYP